MTNNQVVDPTAPAHEVGYDAVIGCGNQLGFVGSYRAFELLDINDIKNLNLAYNGIARTSS